MKWILVLQLMFTPGNPDYRPGGDYHALGFATEAACNDLRGTLAEAYPNAWCFNTEGENLAFTLATILRTLDARLDEQEQSVGQMQQDLAGLRAAIGDFLGQLPAAPP